MFLLGHLGVTLAAARAADRRVNARLAALLAIGPDLVDKPVAWLAPALVDRNTRGFGHTLAAALVVLAALWVWRRRLRSPALLWVCWIGHAALDRLWLEENPRVFLWPLLGRFPPPLPGGTTLDRAFAYNVCGEAVGAALLAWLFVAARRQAATPAKAHQSAVT